MVTVAMNTLSIDDVPEGNLVFCVEMDGRTISQKSKDELQTIAAGVQIRRVLGLKVRDRKERVRSIIVGESGQKNPVEWADSAIANISDRPESTITTTAKCCSVGDDFKADWTAKAEMGEIIDFEVYGDSPLMGENLKEYSRRLLKAPGTKKSKLTLTFLNNHKASLNSRFLVKTQGVIDEVEDETPPSSQVKIKVDKKKKVSKTDGALKCKLCPFTTDRKYDFDRHKLTHSKKKPFTCKNCSRGFSQKSNRDRHQRKCVGAGAGVKSSIMELLNKRAEALNIPVPELKGVNFTPTQRYKLEKEKVAVLEKENSKLRTEILRLKNENKALKGITEPPEKKDKSRWSESEEEEMDIEESVS